MNASQLAHLLKDLGGGSMHSGILEVYRSGKIVGAGYTLILIGAGYGTYLLGKWGYEKMMSYLQEQESIAVAGEVV